MCLNVLDWNKVFNKRGHILDQKCACVRPKFIDGEFSGQGNSIKKCGFTIFSQWLNL